MSATPLTHPRMTVISVQDAVGSVLCHDITVIVPGVHKDRAFKKGHVVRHEDVDKLLRLGKEHLYVFQPQPGFIHEEEAAERLFAAAAGKNLRPGAVKEGKINFHAERQGLLTVNAPLLRHINRLGDITFATLHTFQEVAGGQAVAGVRVVPLMVEERIVREAERLCAEQGRVVDVLPFRQAKVGVVITGSEIYHGRIQDKFGAVLKRKFAALGSEIIGETMTSDDIGLTRDAILDFARLNADMIMVTGGMSVDPDDQTPASIRAAGAEVAAYGAPVFPGAMFLLSYLPWQGGKVPVLGLPGCVMYHRASIFDLIVPRLLAGVEVTAEDIADLGHGGFCATCAECRYPACAFGK